MFIIIHKVAAMDILITAKLVIFVVNLADTKNFYPQKLMPAVDT